MNKNRISLVLTGFFTTVLLSSTIVQAAPYTLIDLGALTNQSSFGNGINSNGVVVGQFSDSSDATTLALFDAHGFSFDGTDFTDLGTLEPTINSATSAAQDVNDSNQIVGFAEVNIATEPTSTVFRDRAFIYQNGTMVDLGLPLSIEASDSRAISINSAGIISGYAKTLSNPGAADAAFFEQAAIIDPNAATDKFTLLGTLAVPGSGVTALSSARASNMNGQIAGWSTTELAGAVSFVHAFYIDPLGTNTMIDMGTLGGNKSSSNDINESGVIVGRAELDDNSVMAFKFDIANDTALVPLGVLVDTTPGSVANGINDLGQIVGFSVSGPSSTPTLPIEPTHAVLFENGALIDLNEQIDCSLGWTLSLAKDINNAGQIVGSGVLNGETHGFLLTPNPTGGPAEVCVDPIDPITNSSSGGSIGWLILSLLGIACSRRYFI